MSKEKVQEILSHVDMSKINLTSFKNSEKKFNELSHLYRNRVILSCFAIVRRSESPSSEFGVSFEMLKKVVENRDLYTYSHIYSMERQAVDKAINDITTRRDRNINDVKVKAIEKRMKENYTQMRKTIELAMQNDSFEQEFNEELVEKCLSISQGIVGAVKRKEAEATRREEEAEVESTKLNASAEHSAMDAKGQTEQILREEEQKESPEHAETKSEKTVEPEKEPAKEVLKHKVSFWQRIFNKMKV